MTITMTGITAGHGTAVAIPATVGADIVGMDGAATQATGGVVTPALARAKPLL